jgi:flagellar biogenesis protein FliO
MICAAGAAMAFAIAVLPMAAQAKGAAGTPSGSTTVTAAPAVPGTAGLNESQILLPDAGAQPAGSPAAGATPPAAPAASGVSTWDFVRMLLILAVVVLVIYVLFWLLRRGAGKKIQENDLIRVLGSRGLAGNRALHLVEVGTSVYLVGASDGGVQLIAEVTDKESLDSMRLKAAEQPSGTRHTFQQVLAEIFRPAKKPFTVGEGVGLLKGQRDRLRKL